MPCLYFLDWRPVGSPPILKQRAKFASWSKSEFQSEFVSKDLAKKLSWLFDDLERVECAARLDGIFLFSITVGSALSVVQKKEAARRISAIVKDKHLKHPHDFHEIHQNRKRNDWFLFRQKSNELDPNNILEVDPVLLDSEECKVGIEKIANNDELLSGLFAFSNNKNHSKKTALLRLRRIFLSKHEYCVRGVNNHKLVDGALNKSFRLYFVCAFSILFFLFLFDGRVNFSAIWCAILGFYDKNADLVVLSGDNFRVFLKAVILFVTEFLTVLGVAFALSLLIYTARHINSQRVPVIRLERHTLGFLSYCCVYSRLVQGIYSSSGRKDLAPASEHADFADIIKVLTTRLEGDVQALEKQRFEVATILAFISAMIAFFQLPWFST